MDNEAIRRGWTDFDVGQLSGVAPYHGMVYLDRSDSIHELMRAAAFGADPQVTYEYYLQYR